MPACHHTRGHWRSVEEFVQQMNYLECFPFGYINVCNMVSIQRFRTPELVQSFHRFDQTGSLRQIWFQQRGPRRIQPALKL